MRYSNDPAYKDFIAADSASFSTLYALNFLPSRYMHEEWVDKIPALESLAVHGFQFLSSKPRVESRLNKILLKQFKLEDLLITSFDTYQKRFLLLPADVILSLIPYLGITIHAHWIAKIIDGKDIKLVKDTLDPSLYAYALKKSSFMFNWAHENHGYTSKPEKVTNKIMQLIFEAGLHLLYFWFQADEESVSKRIELKLPPIYAKRKYGTAAKTKYLQNFDQTRLTMLFRKLAKERHPQWSQLFS